MEIGAKYLGNNKCSFVIWAPKPAKVELKLMTPEVKIIPMEKFWRGYWKVELDNIPPGTRYFYRLDNKVDRPDPASYYQPLGVHGPSEVIDNISFKWEDEIWNDIEIDKLIIYETHVGTFTQEGTFEAIIPKIKDLKETGINAIQIMPIAQFPGDRNWGYDGVYLFAAQNSYGGPQGLKKLVNECHKNDMAVILDVVYNHFGPEGMYFTEFAPYLTNRHNTPWGQGINYDDAHSTEVRNYFLQNMLHWFKDYHIDGLRLDAVHAMYDISAKHILQELAEEADNFSRKQGRKYYMIAESDLNDIKITKSRDLGGYGFDAQWSDDFAHSLKSVLKENKGKGFSDFGKVKHLTKAYKEGFVVENTYSKVRQRNYGNSSKSVPANRFVVFLQNHDQVGNRIFGDRYHDMMDFDTLKLSAGAIFASPFIPMLFMGEEYYEDAPFLYFTHHNDRDLIRNVREGRKRDFQWEGEAPDPQSIDVFKKSKLVWEKRSEGKHKVMLDYYKALISIRNEIPAIYKLDKDRMEVHAFESLKVLYMHRWAEEEDKSEIFALMNFNENDVTLDLNYFIEDSGWNKIIDSADEKWAGTGSYLPVVLEPGKKVNMKRKSFALYKR